MSNSLVPSVELIERMDIFMVWLRNPLWLESGPNYSGARRGRQIDAEDPDVAKDAWRMPGPRAEVKCKSLHHNESVGPILRLV